MSLVDALDLADGDRITADVAVVGAGAAGISLALALRGSGLRVALLESGGFTLDERTQSLYEGTNVGRSYFDLDATRLRLFGGTTNHWTGYCRPLDPLDFSARDWVPWSGWPIDAGDLQPYYDSAHELCELGPPDYDPAAWADELGMSMLPLDGDVVQTTMLQRSPPTRFGDRYRDDVVGGDEDLTLYLHANVVDLETDTAGRRVERARIQHFDGRSAFVEAERFVVATGGIETPRLLLASGSGAAGIGNAHDLVGRFFTEHAHATVGHITTPEAALVAFYTDTHAARGGFVKPTLHITDDVQRVDRTLNAHVLLYEAGPVGHETVQASRAYGGVRDLLEQVQGRPQQTLTRLNVISEQSPNPESRVRLSQARDDLGMRRVALHWRLRPADGRVIRRATEVVVGQLGAAGLGRFHALYPAGDAAPDFVGGNHHMGTTRMHPDPRQGVVDERCLVHGTENVFVAGSAVFPTVGYANPTLTLVALALRLADHLREGA